MSTTSTRKCESCGRVNAFRPRWEQVETCEGCGSWSYVGPLDIDGATLYGREYFHGDEYANYEAHGNVHALNFRRKIDRLKDFAPGCLESVVDLGCAYGFFLEQARVHGGKRIVGFDVGEDAVSSCVAKGFEAHQIRQEGLPADLGFKPTLVTLWDTYEHIPEPSKTLQAVANWQKGTEGLIAITTIDAGSGVARRRGKDWRQFHPPTHLHYPTREALRTHLEDLGYAVVHHGSFGYYRALEQYLAVLPPLKKLVGSGSLARMPLYLNLYDIQFIVGKRRV